MNHEKAELLGRAAMLTNSHMAACQCSLRSQRQGQTDRRGTRGPGQALPRQTGEREMAVLGGGGGEGRARCDPWAPANSAGSGFLGRG